jgi:hypothetical protein
LSFSPPTVNKAVRFIARAADESQGAFPQRRPIFVPAIA